MAGGGGGATTAPLSLAAATVARRRAWTAWQHDRQLVAATAARLNVLWERRLPKLDKAADTDQRRAEVAVLLAWLIANLKPDPGMLAILAQSVAEAFGLGRQAALDALAAARMVVPDSQAALDVLGQTRLNGLLARLPGDLGASTYGLLSATAAATVSGGQSDSLSWWERLSGTAVWMAVQAAADTVYQWAGVQGKTVLTASDSRVCADCQANADTGPIPMWDTFPDGDPPTHPRCRCTVIPVPASEMAARGLLPWSS